MRMYFSKNDFWDLSFGVPKLHLCVLKLCLLHTWKWLSKYSIISKISSSQIAWELDIIAQMAWISLQNFMLLVIDNVITLQHY